MIRSTEHHHTALDGLEARFGARLAASLNERAALLPHDISERLRVSRERAIAVSHQAVQQHTASDRGVVGSTDRGAALLGSKQGLWIRLATWMPLAVLVAGLVLIQQWAEHEQVLAAAEIDAVLLADDLPPSAWTDPGFREYLRAPPP